MHTTQISWNADLQITSFKHKSPIERATILRKRHGLVPISPNSADPAPTFGLQLQPNVTLRRDSWVNLAKTFVVDITIIKKYDDNARSLHYKLAPISITDVRHVLGLTTPRERCTTRVEPVLGAVVHTASQATMEPLPYMNQDVVVGRRDQLNEYTPLVEGSARRSNHDAEARSCSNIVARGGLFNDEAFRQHQTPPIPAHPGSGRGEPWLLLRIYRWLSSWRRVRLWLPSSQTVTSLVVTGLLVAAGGGVIYGGYLLLKVIYTAMAGCYHEIAAVGAHIIASIVGAWKWCTKIVRVSGQGVVHGERAIVEALGGMVAIVKALLGRH